MSDALSNADALGTSTAAVPVGTPAPVAVAEVQNGSASGNQDYELRFNGLMSRYNRDKDTYEAEIESLRAELDLRTQAPEGNQVTAVDPNVQALVNSNQELVERLQAAEAENARARVLAKYPEAAPFADLLVGSNEAELDAVASTLAERMKVLIPKVEATTEVVTTETTATATPAAEVTPAAPVGSGDTGFDAGASTDDVRADAIAKRDFGTFFTATANAALAGATAVE